MKSIGGLLLLLLMAFTTAAQTITKKSLKISRTRTLPRAVSETSGLETFGNGILTHNDSGKHAKLYVIDTASVTIAREIELPVRNSDWEDIAQDSLYFYIADVGNNYNVRPLLHIYRLEKTALADGRVVLDSISLRWPKNADTGKVLNYNCEALVANADSLLLFTKEKGRTAVFSVPKIAGEHTARFKSQFNTDVFVTGAYLDLGAKRLVLCGYNRMLRPFLLEFRDFAGTDFFSGKATRYKICKRFRQVEGITSFNGIDFFISNEHFRLPWLINKRQQLHSFRLD